MTTTILGTSGNDTLLAAAGDTAGAAYLYNGQGGSDNITTGAGADTVFTGFNSGHDLIHLGSGNDSVVGAGELGAISGGAQDTVNAGTGNSIIDFQTGGHDLYNGNTVAGSTGADSVYAYGDTTGHDTFIAGINSDTIVGSQAGNDSVVIGNNYHGNYYIDVSGVITDGGTGDDVLIVGAGNASDSNSTVSGGSFHDQIITYGNTDNVISTNAGSDTVNTLSANDTITTGASGGSLIYSGTGGSEHIMMNGNDTLDYYYENTSPLSVNIDGGTATIGTNTDTFSTLAGKNLVLSHTENTIVTGGSSGTITSSGANDLINLDFGTTTVNTGTGNDTVYAGPNDFVQNPATSGFEDQTINTGGGNNNVYISSGSDLPLMGSSSGSAITEYSVPTAGSYPYNIVTGSDGNLWFSQNTNEIGEISPSGVVTEYALPTARSLPNGMTEGPNGNAWFTEYYGNRIGEISPTGTITEFTIPTANSSPEGIITGPDGNLWFAEGSGNNIGEINPTTGAITEFAVPTDNSNPEDLTTGPNGNIWFTEYNSGKIGELNITTGAITEFSIPTANSLPAGIVTGPNGNLWFAENGSNKIGELNPTTGAITEFTVPTANSHAADIIAGPNGNLWFTEQNGGKIGEINPTTGAITEFATPTANSGPGGITIGPDGNLWFGEAYGDNISKLTLSSIGAYNGVNITSGSNLTVNLSGTGQDTVDYLVSSSGPGGILQANPFTSNQTVNINNFSSANDKILFDNPVWHTTPLASQVESLGNFNAAHGTETFNFGNGNVVVVSGLSVAIPTSDFIFN